MLEADGSGFVSRFTGDRYVAIFGRMLGRLRSTGTADLVRHAEFLEALDDYDTTRPTLRISLPG